MLITLVRAIILGVLQGVTEFIPISSSAHLVIVPWLFQWNDPALTSLSFDVALHLGTLVALLWFFAADWARLLRAWLRSISERHIGMDPDRRLAWLLLIGCVPGAVVGALAEGQIERMFHEPNTPIQPTAMIVMAAIIALMGALLFLADHLARHRRSIQEVSLKDSLLIGLAQAAAVFPGVSRSGSTITAGLALGFKREDAARFSFLLSAPIIAGAGLKSLYNVFEEWRAGGILPGDLVATAVGFLAATISGYLCIKFLLRYLQRHSTDIFVFYRWGLALLIAAVALFRS
jgi:undecaprenyl-diphosphatase